MLKPKRIGALLLALLLIGCDRCNPCGCIEYEPNSSLLDRNVRNAKIEYDHHTFGENRFKIEFEIEDPPGSGKFRKVTFPGSWEKSGDTIVLRPEGGTAYGIVGGATYEIRCDKPAKGDLTLKRSGVLGGELVFKCKRR